MQDFKSPDELKEFLLSAPTESDDEVITSPNPCYSLSWKKDHWIIRANNKRIGMVGKSDIPETVDIKDIDVISGIIAALRKGAAMAESRKLQNTHALESLNTYLAGL